MSYGKVHDVFWDDDKIEALSDRAALLALFLITGRHRNAIGCFKLGTGAITDIQRFSGWGIEGVSMALRELIEAAFIIRDEKTGWTFIRNALKHDPIKGLKAAVHAAKLALAVPSNSIVYQELESRLRPQITVEIKGGSNVHGWPMRTPSIGQGTPIEGVSIPKPSPDPDPEPSPEPEPSPDPEPAPKSVDKKTVVAKEPAARALRKHPDTSSPENRKAAWEQKCQAWMLAHWSTAQFEAALNGYLEGTPFGRAEFERASTEMSAEKTDGSIKPETRLDRPPTTVGTALQPGFDRERALDIPPPFRRSA